MKNRQYALQVRIQISRYLDNWWPDNRDPTVVQNNTILQKPFSLHVPKCIWAIPRLLMLHLERSLPHSLISHYFVTGIDQPK